MGLLNNRNLSQKSVKISQEGEHADSSTALTNPPVELTVEDVELNEEQLDIISGGGESFPIIRVG